MRVRETTKRTSGFVYISPPQDKVLALAMSRI